VGTQKVTPCFHSQIRMSGVGRKVGIQVHIAISLAISVVGRGVKSECWNTHCVISLAISGVGCHAKSDAPNYGMGNGLPYVPREPPTGPAGRNRDRAAKSHFPSSWSTVCDFTLNNGCRVIGENRIRMTRYGMWHSAFAAATSSPSSSIPLNAS